MAGDHVVRAVDKDGNIEAKGFDAGRNLPDLLRGMAAGIRGIGLEPIASAIDDFQFCALALAALHCFAGP